MAGLSSDEIISIRIIAEYFASFDTYHDDVVQGSRGVCARLAWHSQIGNQEASGLQAK